MFTIYFWFFLHILCLVFIIGVVWALSFAYPLTSLHTIGYLWTYHPYLFSVYVLLILVDIALFFVIALKYNHNVELQHPFTHPGSYLYATSVLLLTSFFVETNGASKVADSHPLVLLTSVIFLTMCIFASFAGSFKNRKIFDYSLVK